MFCAKCGVEDKEATSFCKNCGNQISSNTLQASANEELVLPASLLQRFLHNIVDSIAMYVFAFAIGFFGVILLGEVIGIILACIAFFGYYLIFEALFQKTIGKMLTGTKVVNLQGEKPGFLTLLGRTLARYIPFEYFSFLFYGAYPTNGWHDRLSGTLVVPNELTPEQVRKIDPEKIKKQKQGSLVGTIIAIIIIGVVVIAIIGILSSVVLFSLNDARAGARDTRRVAELRQIQLKLEAYYSENDQYPADGVPGVCDDAQAGLLRTLGLTGAGDPGSTTTYGYSAEAEGQSYVLRATLENESHSSLDADVDGTVLNCDCADASGNYCVTS